MERVTGGGEGGGAEEVGVLSGGKDESDKTLILLSFELITNALFSIPYQLLSPLENRKERAGTYDPLRSNSMCFTLEFETFSLHKNCFDQESVYAI